MKGLTLLYAFIGGAVVGGAAAILFAPQKGVDVRRKICSILKKKGIRISDAEVDELVAELTLAAAEK